MTKSQRYLFPAGVALLLASLACTCGALSPRPASTPTPSALEAEPTSTEISVELSPTDTSEAVSAPTKPPIGNGNNDSQFPRPDDAQNVTNIGGTTNLQTSLSLKDALQFYQDAFAKKGYTERTILHTETNTTFSIVFDGDPSGQATVVQAVDLGANRNINIRLESVP